MRGINQVAVAGNLTHQILFAVTKATTAACSFTLVADRNTAEAVISTKIKINAYGEDLVRICRDRLVPGVYVIVTGELMNREHLLEVRAREIVFVSRPAREESPT